ncbi:MAG: 1,2-phenylacetyl-CoA epoxidase subunit PaaD [Bacteroidales bacterium]
MNIYTLLEQICDPEVPVLSILDLGIVRAVNETENEVEVVITPTYSGCPAMDTIATEIREKLAEQGKNARITLTLSPAWTTDWLSEEGKRKLEEYGIAAPLHETADKLALSGQTRLVSCPQCKSTHTQMVSQFGSTACKALFKCLDCLEPFDYFKCLK